MLSEQRDPKSPYPEALAEWLELDYHRRVRPLRRQRKWVTLTCIALALAVTAWSARPRNHKLHEAGPVSVAHAMFNDDCWRCHTESFQPALRLVRGDSVRSTPDEACLACHDGAAHHQEEAHATNCAGCHREHRGKAELVQVADRRCTDCHADLKKDFPAARYDNVASFPSEHPEFRKARPDTLDPVQLHFSHAGHLQLDLAALRSRGASGLEKYGAHLECASCHEPDSERRYMQPVRYEAHCASCHPLTVRLAGTFEDGKLAAAARAFDRTSAPHRSPAEVRAQLRVRLDQFVRDHPVAPGPEKAVASRRPLPGRTPQPVPAGDWHWVKAASAQNDGLPFVDRQLPRLEELAFGYCSLCHIPKTARAANGLPEYQLTQMMIRGYEHSLFRHDSHRLLQCVECHGRANESRLSADVLLPGIDSCKACHVPSGGARVDCVECHRFHPREHERNMNGPLTIGDVSPTRER